MLKATVQANFARYMSSCIRALLPYVQQIEASRTHLSSGMLPGGLWSGACVSGSSGCSTMRSMVSKSPVLPRKRRRCCTSRPSSTSVRVTPVDCTCSVRCAWHRAVPAAGMLAIQVVTIWQEDLPQQGSKLDGQD